MDTDAVPSVLRGPHVLVVTGDSAIRLYLRRKLRAEGFRVRASDPDQMRLGSVADHPTDIVILDLDFPRDGGPSLVRRVREASPVPIVALLSSENEETTVEVLRNGADDCVRKPFRMCELLARVESVLRRAGRERGEPGIFMSGDLEIDLVRRRVLSRRKEVQLPVKPYEVLRVLVEHAGRVVPHEKILTAVWGPERVDRLNYLRVAIATLRAKLERDPKQPAHILTETHIGYRLR